MVREESITEEELPGGVKKKPNEMGMADTSGTETINVEKEESTSDISNTNNQENGGPSADEVRRKNEMFSSMQEEFLCVICQELFVKAHSLSCSHSYCEKCITDWMKANKHCPMCRKTIEGKPVPSIAMDNAITKLVECLPEEAQKERAELLKERSSTKIEKKDVIVISDSPARPSTSGVVTRSASRRTIPVNLVSSDSDSNSDSELSSSQSDNDLEGYDEYRDDFDDPDYTGLPGYHWGRYGYCYRCGKHLL